MIILEIFIEFVCSIYLNKYMCTSHSTEKQHHKKVNELGYCLDNIIQ